MRRTVTAYVIGDFNKRAVFACIDGVPELFATATTVRNAKKLCKAMKAALSLPKWAR